MQFSEYINTKLWSLLIKMKYNINTQLKDKNDGNLMCYVDQLSFRTILKYKSHSEKTLLIACAQRSRLAYAVRQIIREDTFRKYAMCSLKEASSSRKSNLCENCCLRLASTEALANLNRH